MDAGRKVESIKLVRRHEHDTGSTEVQVALLSSRIKHLEKHLTANTKDHSTRRGLIKMVSYRKRLLKYLHREDAGRFVTLKKQLELR
ncbi:MAG: 30S ribosomal protein S15 [Pedosphaera sp.]|nr:30S ribosomal protein S15 [Pedosphaera sp.]MSU42485.1 30S ribosomal protein S15 [Pedosphaera sp.]